MWYICFVRSFQRRDNVTINKIHFWAFDSNKQFCGSTAEYSISEQSCQWTNIEKHVVWNISIKQLSTRKTRNDQERSESQPLTYSSGKNRTPFVANILLEPCARTFRVWLKRIGQFEVQTLNKITDKKSEWKNFKSRVLNKDSRFALSTNSVNECTESECLFIFCFFMPHLYIWNR